MIDNTKLIKLAKEAGYGTQITLFADGDQREDVWGGQFETRKLEKFAELIIQESIDACGWDYGAQIVHQKWYGKHNE